MNSMNDPSDEIELNFNPLSTRIPEGADAEDADIEMDYNKKDHYENARMTSKSNFYYMLSSLTSIGYYILCSVPKNPLKSINLFKAIVILWFLFRKNQTSLFFKIICSGYTEEDYEEERNNPIAVEVIEGYIDVINYFEDVINYFLRLLSNRVPDSKIKRTKLVKEHLLQEQMEDHNSAAEAMIKIKDNGRKPYRVRLNKGFLFKLVVKTDKKKEKVKSGKEDDAKMLRELLANAKKLNEAICNDLYDSNQFANTIINDNDVNRPFFNGNQHLTDQFKDHFIFETKKTIYHELNDFIRKWLTTSANIDSPKNMEQRNFFDLTANKFPTFEALVMQLKKTFIGFCMDVSPLFKCESETDIPKGYDSIIKDFHNIFNQYEEQVSTFYLDEIKQFILTLIRRTDTSSISLLDEVLSSLFKLSSNSKVLLVSEVFKEIKLKCSKAESKWTYSAEMGGFEKRRNAVINSNDDEDITWLQELLEESRKWKHEEGRDKHFSEFSIDKVLVRQTDAAGANIIHVCYLYKKYENFGKYLVQQYPTLAVLPYSSFVTYEVRVSSVKENLHTTKELMPFTGENILHMTVMSRDLEQTRWLLDFYRSHEHTTRDGLKKLLMTAAKGSFFDQYGEFYAGSYPIHFAVCSNSLDMFDLILTYAANIKYDDSKSDATTEAVHKKTLGSTIIFIRDHFGNNCLHLAVHHKLREMYEHILESAKNFLKRDIKTAYAKQLTYGGETSQTITFLNLHETMKVFLKDFNFEGLYGYDRKETPLEMPEDLSQFDTWLQKAVNEKLKERFLYSMNNDLHTPLTLCAQCPKSEDEEVEVEQKEMLEFLLHKNTEFKWDYGPLTCSTLSLEGFDYPMAVRDLYDPLCNDGDDSKYSDSNCRSLLLSKPRKGVLDWICYRDRSLAAEINIIEKYINLKWEGFTSPVMHRYYHLSLVVALAQTTICCCSTETPTTSKDSTGEVIVTVLYPTIALIYIYIFWLEVSLVCQYGLDYIGLQGGIRSSALYDKVVRLVAMLSFLALCIGKAVNLKNYSSKNSQIQYQANDRPSENVPMALSAIFAWMHLYFFFMASDKYGSFVITISRIIGKDIPYFMAFYLIVIVSYACALSVLTVSSDPSLPTGFKSFIYCYWELIQQTFNTNLDLTPEYSCLDKAFVSSDLEGFYNIVLTSFYFVVSILMLNLLIAMINNTYFLYTETSKSLLLLEKYNITCSLDRYLSDIDRDAERKKFAIEFDEKSAKEKSAQSDFQGDKLKKWAFEHVASDKSWKHNHTGEEILDGLQERVVLLIICPQKDFHKGGSLEVPGADENSNRIAKMIMDEKNIGRIDEIFIALDSHYRTHIAHAICWKHVENDCLLESNGLLKWKYPHDKNNPKKFDPLNSYLGVSVKYYVDLYDKHTSHIEKTFEWRYYSYELNKSKITLNFFLEEKEAIERSSKIKESAELQRHRQESFQSLPFKKVMTFETNLNSDFSGTLLKDNILNRLNLYRNKKESIDGISLDDVEYWYHPKEFATILNSDLKAKKYDVIKNDSFDLEWADYYTETLERKGNYKLTIWPEHCLIGSSGHSVVDSLNDSLQHWARSNKKAIQYIQKGQNCKTELYSILEAEVEDPTDVSTAFDSDLFNQLKIADRIIICGQASSHCVKFTVSDLIRYFPEGDDRSKITLLEDGCSYVEGYKDEATQFFRESRDKGLVVTDCADAFTLIDAEIQKSYNLKVEGQGGKAKENDELLEIKSSIYELTELVKSLRK